MAITTRISSRVKPLSSRLECLGMDCPAWLERHAHSSADRHGKCGPHAAAIMSFQGGSVLAVGSFRRPGTNLLMPGKHGNGRGHHLLLVTGALFRPV